MGVYYLSICAFFKICMNREEYYNLIFKIVEKTAKYRKFSGYLILEDMRQTALLKAVENYNKINFEKINNVENYLKTMIYNSFVETIKNYKIIWQNEINCENGDYLASFEQDYEDLTI